VPDGKRELDDQTIVGAQCETKDIDLDFHGDIRLISAEGGIEEYVARFTRGALEWIRSVNSPAAGSVCIDEADASLRQDLYPHETNDRT
jgi:hypothetical protein